MNQFSIYLIYHIDWNEPLCLLLGIKTYTILSMITTSSNLSWLILQHLLVF